MPRAKISPGQKPLFPIPESAWKPPAELPELTGIKTLSLDTEYEGKNRYTKKLLGISYCTEDGRSGFLPVRCNGGNLDEDSVRRWAQGELRGKYIIGANVATDAECLGNWGVDLEAQGNKLHDIQHSAALLNEYRYGNEFSLEKLGLEYAGRGKSEVPGIDKAHMGDYHSSIIGPYAEEDARLTMDVHKAQQPQILEQGLERTQDLEDRLIWCNLHIERNAARLDWDKLAQWDAEIHSEIGERLITLKTSGKCPMPFSANSSKSWSILLEALDIPEHLVDGKESYDKTFLKTLTDPVAVNAVQIKKLQGLLSKYFTPYPKHRIGDKLMFNLYSLRGEMGTVSGRYSAANVNTMQVVKPEAQKKNFGDKWIVRELFIPDDGMDFFAADASQIEFRLFAHFSGDEELQAQYIRDPKTDFYTAVAGLTGQTRSDAKITSLGKLYGMGIEKLAGWLGKACNCGKSLKCGVGGERCDLPNNDWKHEAGCGRLAKSHTPDCPAVQAMQIAATYDLKFPAAKALAKAATKTATTRGYVFDMLGQRHRFPSGSKSFGDRGPHSALNRIIQGSAAKVFKLKLLQLYENRAAVGIHKLRMPVHDEATGDLFRGGNYRHRLNELLHASVIDTKVPLLWELGIGENWAKAKP